MRASRQPDLGGRPHAGQVAYVQQPSLARLFGEFLYLGATAFGGPAIVGQMRELAVEHRGWLRPGEFDEGLALSQVLPGPTAMQCAATTGLRLRGFAGALVAFVGFGLPAFLTMLAASAGYEHVIPILAAQTTLRGLRVAVVAIVAWAAFEFARTQIKTRTDLLLVAVAAVPLLFGCHPVLVVSMTALVGIWRCATAESPSAADSKLATTRSTISQVGPLLLLAAVALTALALTAPTLAALGLTMMKVDAIAFGGGFAALPLMHDEFVRATPTMSSITFLDGIALGQITPGPVVITATFVGYQVRGLLGAAVATAGVFFPSFTLVVGVAPWFTRLRRYGRFRAATRAASLAFVGLLVSVAFQFARAVDWTPSHGVLGLAALACLGLRLKTLWVVLGCGIARTLMHMLGLP